MTSLKNGFYYHYKHNPEISINNYSYEVVGIAKNTEDNTLNVIYRPLYESKFLSGANYFSRPYHMFVEEIVIDNKTVPRFSKISNPTLISSLEEMKAKLYNE